MQSISAGQFLRAPLIATVLLVMGSGGVTAAPTPNISATRHNLSVSGTGDVVASSETEVCVFCHTPHGANSSVNAPLWNRNLSGASYDTYESNSLNALGALTVEGIRTGELDQPAGSSRLCLSCHDGTLAIGAVGNQPGRGAGSGTIAVSGTTTDNMRDGPYGKTSGYTRNLSADLRNDHPISLTFDTALANADGELRDPDSESHVGLRGSAAKPALPLEPTGTDSAAQVQCGTCHDAHLNAEKFLRLNRFQQNTAAGASFNETNDQICIGCHDKMGTSWGQSAHANPSIATQTYKTDAAGVRGFPAALPVWQAGCLNCHDTHTVSGSRRLLREGVGGSSDNLTLNDDGRFKLGQAPLDFSSSSAIEETCYQCHNTGAQSVVEGSAVPNIWTEFETRAVTMPITTGDQPASREVHDIQDADFIESAENLGKNDGATSNTANRHVECTDCHNPHRVIRNSLFNGNGDGTRRTHVVGGMDGNLASGVLRGAWGVEPVYGTIGSTWPQVLGPSGYLVKKGDPTAATGRTETHLTREYQLCFKCHSDYSNDPDNMPQLGTHTGGTNYDVNKVKNYTNVAGEFAVNATDGTTLAELTGTDQCEGGGDATCTPSGSPPGDDNTNAATGYNHRSWHPVHYPTGRTATERGGSDTNFLAPFKANLGLQTMQCSDCHGSEVAWAATTGANTSQVQGPHGSNRNFLLKGTWTATERPGDTNSGMLCKNCHQVNVSRSESGWGNADTTGHNSSEHGRACGRCHIAVPHGWKNKAFLANLRCVGKEGGQTSDCVSVSANDSWKFTFGPYYIGTFLRIRTWQRSRTWTSSSCGTPSSSGDSWMSGPCTS